MQVDDRGAGGRGRRRRVGLGGAALGGILGWMAPRDIDPLLDSTLKLDPPSLAILPGNGIRAEPVAIAMVGGSF